MSHREARPHRPDETVTVTVDASLTLERLLFARAYLRLEVAEQVPALVPPLGRYAPTGAAHPTHAAALTWESEWNHEVERAARGVLEWPESPRTWADQTFAGAYLAWAESALEERLAMARSEGGSQGGARYRWCLENGIRRITTVPCAGGLLDRREGWALMSQRHYHLLETGAPWPG